MSDNIREKTLSNLIWKFAERCGVQGVGLVVSIILGRLLEPSLFGSLALITVFISIFQVFVDCGLCNALIQKKDADDLDFSTVFYFNITACVILYLVMFFAAPWIAYFYDDPSLTALIRVLSLTLIISGICIVQQAYISRTLQFKRFFFATLGGSAGAAIVGILLAYKGFGIWALVLQQIFSAAVRTFILWTTVKWRPQIAFSFGRLKVLFAYGWKLLVSALISIGFGNLWQLVIGKFYSSSELAFYNRGDQFPSVIVANINTSINAVLFPVMSKEQENIDNLRAMTRTSIRVTTFVMAPLMIGLAVTAPGVVRLLLTEKWLPCVPYLRIICIIYMFQPIQTANLNALLAMGRSDLTLKLAIANTVIGLCFLFSTMWFGVMAMAYSLLLRCALGQIINCWPNKKLLDYNYLTQLKDILPSIVLALVMGLCVLPVSFLPINNILILLIQVLLGAIVYVTSSILIHYEPFYYLLNILKTLFIKEDKNR